MDRGGLCSDRPIRVLLVDDQARVRRALRQLLEAYPDFDVVGEVDSGENAIEATRRLDPDVVLMDCSLATTISGITAARDIKQKPRIPRVVLLTTSGHPDRAEKALNAGESVVEGCTAEMLLDVVQRAFDASPSNRSRLE